MTDEEAYELLIKYSDERGIIMQKEMIRNIGVNETAKLILAEYKQVVPDEFKEWLLQGLNYLNRQIQESLN